MDIISIVLLAIALSVDCFVVSVANGTAIRQFRWLYIVKYGVVFGVLHAFMPLIGWLLGIGFKDLISEWDHWLALLILTILGCRMIKEGFSKEEPDETPLGEDFKFSTLFLMVLASGVDEIGTGLIFVSFPMESLCLTVMFLFVFSTIFFVVGNYIGCYAEKKLPVNVQLIGGLVLIAIGIKIFEEHTGMFSRIWG
jgi:putative Mn2+ efflux pump MntP